MKLDQETEEISGRGTDMGDSNPSFKSDAVRGMTPEAAISWRSSIGTPSNPMIRSFLRFK